MLVQLARIDGVVVRDEINLIRQIGKAGGMSTEEIGDCFDHPSHVGEMSELSDDQKYDYVYNIVQLMKIDGRLYKEEIKFCARMASKLGYEGEVLRELILRIYSDPHITTDKVSLKSTIQKYLKK